MQELLFLNCNSIFYSNKVLLAKLPKIILSSVGDGVPSFTISQEYRKAKMFIIFFKVFLNSVVDNYITELISEGDTNIGITIYNPKDGRLYYSHLQMKNYTISQVMISSSPNMETKIWRVIALY